MTEYPTAFWAETFSKMIGWAANLIVIYLMVLRFETISNWSAYEVLLLYSMNATAYSLSGFFMYNAFGGLSQHIQMGTFDEMLTKPVNPFLYLCFKGFGTGYIGNLISTLTALVICFMKLNISLSFLSVIYFLIIIFGSTLIHSGLFMFTNIPVFWFVKNDALLSFRWALDEFIRYPVSIYDRWIQILLTLFIPMAFINFFPIQFFLKKQDFIGFNPIIVHLTPVIGLVLFFSGYLFFFWGIKHYKSTGS